MQEIRKELLDKVLAQDDGYVRDVGKIPLVFSFLQCQWNLFVYFLHASCYQIILCSIFPFASYSPKIQQLWMMAVQETVFEKENATKNDIKIWDVKNCTPGWRQRAKHSNFTVFFNECFSPLVDMIRDMRSLPSMSDKDDEVESTFWRAKTKIRSWPETWIACLVWENASHWDA